jgi:hypothetical protein
MDMIHGSPFDALADEALPLPSWEGQVHDGVAVNVDLDTV